MQKTRILFVCTANINRSPTAEALFAKNAKYETASCGIHLMSNVPISKSAIEWAEHIICMENYHRDFICQNFPEAKDKPMYVLDIPDRYGHGDLTLIDLLKNRMSEYDFFI